MDEYIKREEIALKVKRNLMPNVDVDGTVSVENAERYFLNLLAEQPAADVVSGKVFEQVKWERDTALKTLEEHGIGFGQKADVVEVVRCKDCKHWGGVVFGYRCRKFSGMNTQIQTLENDFCSFGARKTD